MQTTTGKSASQFIHRGEACLRAGRLVDARDAFKRVLDKEPGNARAIEGLGVIACKIGSFHVAVELFSMLVRLQPTNGLAFAHLGNALLEGGKLEQARTAFANAVELSSQSPQPLNGLGIIAMESGQLSEAVEYFNAALHLSPNDPVFLNNRGNAYKKNNQIPEAIADYEKSLIRDVKNSSTLYNLGVAYLNVGRSGDAKACFLKATKYGLDSDDLLYNFGICFQREADISKAIEKYDRLLSRNPHHFSALFNRAMCQHLAGDLSAAISSYDRAIELEPGSAISYNNRGIVKSANGDGEGAIDDYSKAVEIEPSYADAYYNRANCLRKQGRLELAEADYRIAAQINPQESEYLYLCGCMFEQVRDYQRAENYYSEVLNKDPNHAKALLNVANIYLATGDVSRAIEHFRRSYAADCNTNFLLGVLTHSEMNGCDWRSYSQQVSRLVGEIQEGKASCAAFPIFGLVDSPAIQKRVAEIYNKTLYSEIVRVTWPPRKIAPQQKIRVGYFTADLHRHATTYLIAELFELHDKSRFEVFIYSFGFGPRDEMYCRIAESVTQVFDMRHCTDEEIAVHAQRTLLDIAIDLKGFTRDSRPGIFARGCAPVHINFLGYPGTMGAPYIDYLIADRFVVPEDEREHYSERILYTPGAYQPNDRTKRISERVFTRRELGLPENGFVFCSFNNNYKVIPEVFDTWTQILLQTPGSVLWLYKDNDVAKDNLIEEAAARNVDPNRIIFAEKMPLSEHLSRHRLADLFLDTFPCSAHTTASDALWSGLPIVTMCGRSFASRVAGSLLFHVGLSELITYDRASYERLALELAHDPERLKKIKEKLTIAVKSSELFDTRAYAKNLESLFEGLVVGQH